MKRGSSDYFIARYESLYRAYKEAFKREEVRTHNDAILIAINSPSPRFWISTFQAYRQILRIKSGRPPAYPPNSKKRKIIEQVYERYKQLENLSSFRGTSTFFIVSFAVMSRAPSFYMSFDRARKIISAIKRSKEGNEKRQNP